MQAASLITQGRKQNSKKKKKSFSHKIVSKLAAIEILISA